MGIVRIEAEIGASNDNLKKVEFMVDTGAFHTMLPPAICDELGLVLNLLERVVTADNRRLTVELGAAHLRIDGHEGGILVGKISVPWPLLGVSALESLGLKVNPVEKTLEPTRPFGESPALGTP